MPYYINFSSFSSNKPISPPFLLICSIFSLPYSRLLRSSSPPCAPPLFALATVCASSICRLHRLRLLCLPSPSCAPPPSTLSRVCTSSIHPLYRMRLLRLPSPLCGPPLFALSTVWASSICALHHVNLRLVQRRKTDCSEGDHPDSSKSFLIGSVVFNILVGLKPYSFSPVFPIEGEIQAIVRATYVAKACIRYGKLMHELRALGVRPDFVNDEAWNIYNEYWASVDFDARSDKASHNIKHKKAGSCTRHSKHTSGTWTFRTYEDILALDKDEDNEVTPNDVFLHVHTKDHDEHTRATPDQSIDEAQLYYDATWVCLKGRVYGLESLAKKKRRYANPGASTSQELKVRHLEFDALVQKLAKFEAFV
ncbi:hypothetical protein Syun_012149 [Stephania yunnanensis]|uniref:Uncharacterized protein n=1 Tax=Stephania yunnanensis TaxID=152371 RepID=A0AAP0PH91_9MAGN